MQHYRKLQSAHANQTLTMLDGTQTQRYGRLERGIIQGNCRDMHVVIADEKGFDGLGFDPTIGSQDDKYAVINLFDSSDRYIDSVAIVGADDIDHAIHLALNQFDYLCPAYATLVANEGDGNFEPSFDSLCWESDTIAKLMNNRSQDRGHYLPIITQKMLVTEKNRVTHNDVLWDGANLVSHGNDYARLLVDLQKNDSHHQLTDMFDMAGFLAELNIEELGLDALMDTNNRLDLMKERLFRALIKQPMDGLTVTDVILTKPFKKAGVANVAMQFNLSDGQTFTILFHNPDANPKKLAPQDMMVSWKWLLNKRDITAAVSPKNGENVQLAPLAMRMMKVAKANSKRFAAAQAKKAQNQQELTDAQKEVDDKKAKLDTINAHIAELQTELEKVGRAKTEQTITEPTTSTSDLVAKQQAAAMEKFNAAKEILLNNGWRQFNKNASGVEYPYYANGTDGRVITAYPQDDGHATVKVVAGLNDDETENVVGYVMSDMAKDAQELAQKLNNLVKNWVMDNGNSLHPIIEREDKLGQADEQPSEPADNPTPAPQSEMNPEEKKLQRMLDEQAMMKDVNKIVKSKKLSDEEKTQQLIDKYGISRDTAHTLATGEGTWDKQPGFPSYKLTNLNNRIKTQQAKVDTMRKVESINNTLDGEDMVLAGVSIILNKEANRVQLDFPDKPNRDIIGVLKKNGWKWSPSNQVWQRQLTDNAMDNARKVIQAYADDEGIDMQEESSPTPEPTATPPAIEETANATQGATMTEDNTVNQSNPNYTQNDIDYLNSIINGDIDPLDVDMDKIIAIGEKDETDPLFEQALQIINDAEDKATAGV